MRASVLSTERLRQEGQEFTTQGRLQSKTQRPGLEGIAVRRDGAAVNRTSGSCREPRLDPKHPLEAVYDGVEL